VSLVEPSDTVGEHDAASVSIVDRIDRLHGCPGGAKLLHLLRRKNCRDGHRLRVRMGTRRKDEDVQKRCNGTSQDTGGYERLDQ